jgi:uncharacterized delta-60 repeat protein
MLSSTIRINNDGTIDPSYQTIQGASFVKIALQSDNSIIGAGDSFVWKLNPDGTQSNFGPFVNIGGNTIQVNLNNSSGKVVGLHIQNDNKIILTGTFNKISGTTVPNHIIRFNPDGTIDTSFSPGTGASQEISTSQLTDDGKILIGGFFSQYNGIVRNYIARINNNTPPLYSETLLERDDFNVIDNQLMLYPNPASGTFTIQTSSKMIDGIVNVYSLLGQRIKQFQIVNPIINLELSEGIYIISIEKEGSSSTKKMVVK